MIILSRKIKFLYSVLVLILLVMVLFMYLPGWVFAQFGIGNPFGGLVLFSIPCPCNGGTMITVGPPRPGVFMVDAGSIVYEKFNYSIGHWVLGLSDAFEPCLVPSGLFGACIPIGGGGRVRIMGTS